MSISEKNTRSGSAGSLSADFEALNVDQDGEDSDELPPFFYAPLGITIRRPRLKLPATSVPDDSSVTLERPLPSSDYFRVPDKPHFIKYKMRDEGEKKTCPCMRRRVTTPGSRENMRKPKPHLNFKPFNPRAYEDPCLSFVIPSIGSF